MIGRDWTHDWIAGKLADLDMVEWDRYTVGHRPDEGTEITVYGWIDREKDEYKDFVITSFYPETDENIIWYTTSSDRYTGEIYRILYGEEPDDHNDCQRVEDTFDVPNAIELHEQTTLSDNAPSRSDSSEER